ncbi:MAG: type I-U CRISPR-associated protein Csx17 [Gemmataceae bacterium]|nr:type I-U CRISPR-associated protein Csx17 [Gemmataceae bacterium]
MPEIILTGCTPEPLMNYLKALGVFRLVAEQADPNARMAWKSGVACIACEFDREQISQFFLAKYHPTPILAPWNGGSGFYGGGAEPLKAIEKSKSPRLAQYRNAINAIRDFAPKAKPKDDDKRSLLVKCRSELADELIPWLDVCFVLGEERTSFFPLLGTGGNDGRLDFTNNFMQRIAEIMECGSKDKPSEESGKWLASALFGDTLVALGKSAIGQFNPGGIGGANGVQGKFEADSRVNPWDYVLMIEGALLFAGSMARRLGTATTSRAVFPFSVESVAVGYGSASASEETTDGSRAELWLPLWARDTTLAEVRQLFAEGRAQLGKQQAKNAVEFSLAVCLLGICRGIASFVRYGFLKRNGLAFLAAPIGRVPVTPRPNAKLLNDPPLMAWLDSLRRACSDKDKTPARYQAALRGIDRAIFRFSNRSDSGDQADRREFVNVLVALGNAERTLSGGLAFCKDKFLRPLRGLSARWIDQANDGSAEFALAAALAGIRGESDVGPMRVYLEPIAVRGNSIDWNAGSTSAVWTNVPVSDNLAAVFRRRQLESFRSGFMGVPLHSSRSVPLADVLAFLRGHTDDERLGALTLAMSAVTPTAEENRPFSADGASFALPFEFGVSRLVVEPLAIAPTTTHWRLDNDSGSPSTPDPDAFDYLHARNPQAVQRCVEHAARRLRASGFSVMGYRNRLQAGKELSIPSSIDPTRLLAAMLFPLSRQDLEVIANSVLYPPESEE